VDRRQPGRTRGATGEGRGGRHLLDQQLPDGRHPCGRRAARDPPGPRSSCHAADGPKRLTRPCRGCAGFRHKGDSIERLSRGPGSLRGGPRPSPAMLQPLRAATNGSSLTRALTPRETPVLLLFSTRLKRTDQQPPFISIHALRHDHSIMINSPTQAGAVAIAIREGLITATRATTTEGDGVRSQSRTFLLRRVYPSVPRTTATERRRESAQVEPGFKRARGPGDPGPASGSASGNRTS